MYKKINKGSTRIWTKKGSKGSFNKREYSDIDILLNVQKKYRSGENKNYTKKNLMARVNQIWKIVARVSTLTNDEEEERGQIWLLKHDGEMTTTGRRRHVVVRHFLNWQIEPFVKLNRFLAYRLSNRSTTTLILSCFVIHHPSLYGFSSNRTVFRRANLQRWRPENTKNDAEDPTTPTTAPKSFKLLEIQEQKFMRRRWERVRRERRERRESKESVIFFNWWGGNERER